MTRKRFKYHDEQLSADLSSDGVSLSDPTADYADELYDRLGERFPVTWESKSRAEPIIDTNNIPGEITESDIEGALIDMKESGIL